MLIVSKFHDYYDTALAHGIDKTCVYRRETVEREHPTGPNRQHRLASNDYRRRNKDYVITRRVIGFCGELYPQVQVTRTYSGTQEDEVKFFYTLDPLLGHLDEILPEQREQDNRRNWTWWGPALGDESFKFFFDPNNWAFLKPLFEERRVPILVYKSRQRRRPNCTLVLNPQLKDYEFMKVKDPYTACQEIHMYLSGVLGGLDRDTAEVGNDDRIKQRGFDKWSFRREPTKRRQR